MDPHPMIVNEFFALLQKLKTANQLLNKALRLSLSRLLDFSSLEMCQNHVFPWPRTSLGELTCSATPLDTLAGGEGACSSVAAPLQEPHPVPAVSPSGLWLQLFGPAVTELPG